MRKYKFTLLDQPIVFRFPSWDVNLLSIEWVENWILDLYVDYDDEEEVWRKVVPGKTAIAVAEIQTWYRDHTSEDLGRCSHTIVLFENKYWLVPYVAIKAVKAAEIPS